MGWVFYFVKQCHSKYLLQQVIFTHESSSTDFCGKGHIWLLADVKNNNKKALSKEAAHYVNPVLLHLYKLGASVELFSAFS